MTAGSRRRDWVLHGAAAGLIFVSPFLSFLKHQGYPLWRPEALGLLFSLCGVGLLLGFLLWKSPLVLRVLWYTALLVIWLDLRTEWFGESQWPGVGVAFLSLAAALFLLRGRAAGLLLAFFAAVTLVSLMEPSFFPFTVKERRQDPASGGHPPGRILHLVLDEFIGVDGIPTDVEAGRRVQAEVRDVFVSHGFRVFGQAYSRHYLTSASLSNLVNFADEPAWEPFYDRTVFSGSRMSGNRYFRGLRESGRRIHVFQTDYMDFCRTEDGFEADRCVTVESENLHHIEKFPLSAAGRARMIFGLYTRLSFLWREAKILTGVTSPVRRVSSASSLSMLEAVRKDVLESREGDVIFAHVLLPHFPYLFGPDCRPEPDVKEWRNASDTASGPLRNTPEERRERYLKYLDQVRCSVRELDGLFTAMKERGIFEDTLILVHGDHGSRIGRRHPHNVRLDAGVTEEDFVDGFSTLFAVKAPGVPAGIDNRLLGLDDLFGEVIREGRVPDGVAWARPPYVYLVSETAFRHRMVPVRNRVGPE